MLPKNVWLTTISASVSSGGTGGAASGVRSAIAGPAFTITGCTTSHPMVATLISELRRMDGVVRVSLDSSVKSSGTDGSSSTGDCRGGTGKRPQFSMTIFLTAPTATPVETAPAPAAAASTGGAPATGGTTQ